MWTRTLTMNSRSGINVSPELIMPREQIRRESLAGPSGAYLTWLSILEDEQEPDEDADDA